MRHNHLDGQFGDALNVVLAAAGYTLRRLIHCCARFRGGQVRILLLLELIASLLGLLVAQSRLPFRRADGLPISTEMFRGDQVDWDINELLFLESEQAS